MNDNSQVTEKQALGIIWLIRQDCGLCRGVCSCGGLRNGSQEVGGSRKCFRRS